MNSTATETIFVVDDHAEMVALLAAQLRREGYEVQTFTDARSAIDAVRAGPPALIITDLRMEEVDGLDLLESVHGIAPDVEVIIMTAFGAVETAVDAIKRGAYHYVTKPFELREILLYVQRALADRHLRREHRALKRLALDTSSLDRLIGVSKPMRRLREMVARVAATDANVLIRGESGTGKELVAQALHFTGLRSEHPFVPVNCTVLPDSLLESELFGHVAGAFTGASQARKGLFVEADRGTIFLDEIGDMAPDLQTKLLRVLEERLVRPVGSDTQHEVDVRIVAATHQNIEELIERGDFRADLFFRLNVVPIRIPSLRERPADIPLLVPHFIDEARDAHPRTKVESFGAELVEFLTGQEWPGNVRQLKNVVERLIVLGDAEVADLDTLRKVREMGAATATFPFPHEPQSPRTLRQATDAYIEWVLDLCENNKTKAAEILDIDVSTIYRRTRDAD